MEQSIKNAMTVVKLSIENGVINKSEAKDRLEGIMLLANEIAKDQPFSASIHKFTLEYAQSILNQF